jgi:hypothetical protein
MAAVPVHFLAAVAELHLQPLNLARGIAALGSQDAAAACRSRSYAYVHTSERQFAWVCIAGVLGAPKRTTFATGERLFEALLQVMTLLKGAERQGEGVGERSAGGRMDARVMLKEDEDERAGAKMMVGQGKAVWERWAPRL